VILAAGLTPTLAATAPPGGLNGIKHLIVIYQENHSLDNLWGRWPGVNGLADPSVAAKTTQVDQGGKPFGCLAQNDVNLTSPPLSAVCKAPLADGTLVDSHFKNEPFKIDDVVPASATTCYESTPAAPSGPANGVPNGKGKPGGCTRDLVHRYYQEQYQIDGGKQDRYVVGSDAAGLAMGYNDTTALPIYQYLTAKGSPSYVITDNFFAGTFGGSFLNHQWLVSAQAPVYAGADKSGSTDGCTTGTVKCDLHSVVDANGMPADNVNAAYPLYRSSPTPGVPAATAPRPTIKDNPLTEAADAKGNCAPSYAGAATPPAGTVCGDYAVNTIQPFNQPFSPGTPDARRLPLLATKNIGDAMSGAGVTWAWYSGGWDNAAGITTGPGWTNGTGPTCSDPKANAKATFPNCPDTLFQFHHQPFNYYANFADDTAAHKANRAAHLKDEADLLNDLKKGTLPAVSFVKPLGAENQHPGYASTHQGDQKVVDIIKAAQASADWASTAIVITYDEFGGSWDHVAPPTAAGISDKWGPGTRVPGMVISPLLPKTGVDHTSHDTTSILATIEHRFGLPALGTRDAAVADLSSVFAP
jgi:phospholipase C